MTAAVARRQPARWQWRQRLLTRKPLQRLQELQVAAELGRGPALVRVHVVQRALRGRALRLGWVQPEQVTQLLNTARSHPRRTLSAPFAKDAQRVL
jgi:hypothetical protein